MVVTTILGILAVFSAYLTKYNGWKFGLKLSFSMIFIFLALRYNFGNDYEPYLNVFNSINAKDQFKLFEFETRVEIGWVGLCRLFKPLGFFAMTAFLSLLSCIVYYRFIKNYVPERYYWLAVFIYIFSPSFMLIHSSAMRQSLAIVFFILSIDFILKRNLTKYLLCIGLSSLFHYSALILIPAFLLGFTREKISNVLLVIIFSLYLLLFVLIEQVGPIINQIVSTHFHKYEHYEGAATIGSGLGVVYSSVLLILLLYFDRYQDKKHTLIFRIAAISFFFIPLAFYIQMIGRISMYFAPATIVAYPMLQETFQKNIYKLLFISLIILVTAYTYFQFYQSDVWKPYFFEYHTIFASPEIL